MSKFTEVKYDNGLIEIEDYNYRVHYKNIFCPECEVAPMHIVEKQNVKPYFASNSNESHDFDCQYRESKIENNTLTSLINSEIIEDKNRLNFLIKSNLKSAIQLLLKKLNASAQNIIQKNITEKIDKNNPNLKNYKRESIRRIHIKNLLKESGNIESSIIIYGQSFLDIKLHDKEVAETKEKYQVKQLLFKDEKKFVFSIFLSINQSKYDESVAGNIKFAVFGEMIRNGTYLNFKISTTKNMIIISE